MMIRQILFSAILMFAAVAAPAVTETMFRFGDDERWVVEPSGGSCVPSAGPEALEISGSARRVGLRNRKYGLIRYCDVRALRLEVESAAGSGRIAAVWRGPDGKLEKSAPAGYSAGSSILSFQVPAAAASRRGMLFDHWEIVPESEAFSLRFRKAEIDRSIPELEAVRIGFDPFIAQPEKPLEFELRNLAPVPQDFELSVTATDFYFRKLAFRRDVHLKVGGEERVVFPGPFPARGIWYLEFRLKSGSGVEHRITDSVAVMTPSGPNEVNNPHFLFGVCSHPQSWSRREQEREIEAAARMGAKIMRCSIDWGGLEPSRGEWKLDTFDRLVELLGAHHMEMQGMFAFTARHAASPEIVRNAAGSLEWSRSKPDLKLWRAYVAKLAERYRGRVRYWEVWNEPDIDTFARFGAEDYVELLKSAAGEVRQADPKAKVLTAGFATLREHRRIKDPKYQEKTLLGAAGAFDIHAYHEHGLFPAYVDVIENRFLPLRAATGCRVPWYANETAVAALDGDERIQATTLFKKLLYAWSRGAIGYNWYDLRNDGYDPHDGEHNYGMLTHDFRPKAVYVAYNMLAGTFGNAEFVRSFEPGGTPWLFLFRTPEALLLPGWMETDPASVRWMPVRTDASRAEFIDLMGNRSGVALRDGFALYQIGSTPGTLKLDGASFAEPGKPLLEAKAPAVTAPGRPFRVTFTMANPLAEALEIELLAAGGLRVDWETPMPVRIPAGETGSVTAMVTAPEAEIPVFRFRTSVPEWNGSLTLPAAPGRGVPSGSDFSRPCDFKLDSPTQVVSLYEADPGKREMVWRNPADLSARIWLGESEHHLLVKAIVADDRHCQPEEGEKIWQGDGVQFALQFPGQNRHWELGFARTDDGRGGSHVWEAAAGFDLRRANAGIVVETNRDAGNTYYLCRIPYPNLGISREQLKRGFRFNILVNDNDGTGRKGWIQLAPGLGSYKNPSGYPFILFY